MGQSFLFTGTGGELESGRLLLIGACFNCNGGGLIITARLLIIRSLINHYKKSIVIIGFNKMRINQQRTVINQLAGALESAAAFMLSTCLQMIYKHSHSIYIRLIIQDYSESCERKT